MKNSEEATKTEVSNTDTIKLYENKCYTCNKDFKQGFETKICNECLLEVIYG